MKQLETVYSFLKERYKDNEPIFLSDLSIAGMKEVAVRQQLKKLVEEGRLKRFDTGIYFIPKKSMFKSGSTLSVDEVIRKKYIVDGNGRCGYVCGILLANKLGLTTQVPMAYEVCSNKATTNYRDTQIAVIPVIHIKPYVEVNTNKARALQFLDLMREVIDISELEGNELTDRLIDYLKKKNMGFESLKPYLKFYPDKIYKNMYEAGLLNGMVT